jgi:WbqC-like protein family
MSILLHPTYFPSVSHYVEMVHTEEICFEIEDNFQKQTNRNRMYIYSPNGIQLLNIPVKKSATIHQKTKDIKIENDFDWQKQHFKSLEAGYRSSPFFEFYEDYVVQIYSKRYTYLMDLNFETLEIVDKCLMANFQTSKTTEYFRESKNCIDFRTLANGKNDTSTFEPYKQVFDQKHGFINNLSILDLLFNEGRFAMDYLKNQKK